jgi:hypothetical protein
MQECINAGKNDGRMIHASENRPALFFIVFLFCLSAWNNFAYFMPMRFCDFRWRWQECAYVLQGTNPIDVAKEKVPADTFLGKLPPFAGTAPWAYVLGNALVFGFLPYSLATKLGYAAYFLCAGLACWIVYRYLQKQGYPPLYRILAVLCIPVNYYWNINFWAGNQAAIVGCLAVMMICIIDRHPKTAGALHALMMVKPHIAAIFYLSFLVKKNFRTFFTSAAIVGAAWLAAGWITRTSPMQMLCETADQGLVAFRYSFMGIMSFLQFHGVADKAIYLQLSMAVGCLFVLLLLWFTTKRVKNADNFLYYAIPAIASTFWCYKQTTDFFLISILAIAFVQFFARIHNNKWTFILALGLCFIYFQQSYCWILQKSIVLYINNLCLVCTTFLLGMVLLSALEAICKPKPLLLHDTQGTDSNAKNKPHFGLGRLKVQAAEKI